MFPRTKLTAKFLIISAMKIVRTVYYSVAIFTAYPLITLTSLKNTNCHTTQLMGELNVAFVRKRIQQSICGVIIFKVITWVRKYVCGIENCGKSYPLKRYRDEHECNFHKPTSNIRYVCDICSEIFESMELLQQHKIKDSSTKKHVCRYCKVRGYTRSNDRDGHEAECPQRFTSVRPKEAKSSSSSKKKGPKKKLFAAKPNQVAAQSTSMGKRVDPVDMFPSEPDESESDVPSQRHQPMRNCKNGVSEGFYKNGCSPNVKKECNSSSESGTSSVKLPKPSIKGQHRCSICKTKFCRQK